ncbi:hypothetical protein FOZ62_027934, partial [Perkinsus olseni]
VDSQYDVCKQDAVELRQEVEDLKEYVAQRSDAERVRSVEQLRESQQEHWRKVQKQLDGMRERMDRISGTFDEERWQDKLQGNVESNVRQAVAGYASRWQSDLVQIIELLNAVYIHLGMRLPTSTLMSAKRFKEQIQKSKRVVPPFTVAGGSAR